VSGSLEQTDSAGRVFIGEGFSGRELASNDFEGLCLIQEISAAAAWGRAVTVFALGIPWKSLVFTAFSETGALAPVAEHAPEILGPAGFLLKKAVQAGHMGPKAILLASGRNLGFQLGASATSSMALVTRSHLSVPASSPDDPIEEISVRSSSTQTEAIDIPSDVLFDFFEHEFRKKPPEAVQATSMALAQVAALVKSKSPRSLEIWGHTDSIEHHPGVNQPLSERRANTVRQWLIANNVMEASKIIARGAGATKPVASNQTEEGRQSARRDIPKSMIEIVVTW
jgi:outer membrane protein OmpA-like peptidoglycan-associated protein